MRTSAEQYLNSSGLIDKKIGHLYELLETVKNNLSIYKHISYYMENLFDIHNNLTDLVKLSTQDNALNFTNDNITDLTTYFSNLNTLITNRDSLDVLANEIEENSNLAQKWANEAEDTEVETGLFSALHYAAKASSILLQTQTIKDETNQIKTDTETLKNAVDLAKTSVETKAQEAADSAQIAITKATEAAASAEAAANSTSGYGDSVTKIEGSSTLTATIDLDTGESLVGDNNFDTIITQPNSVPRGIQLWGNSAGTPKEFGARVENVFLQSEISGGAYQATGLGLDARDLGYPLFENLRVRGFLILGPNLLKIDRCQDILKN